MLDDNLNELVGGEKNRRQYMQYNTLENIHDVVLVYEGQFPIVCAGFRPYGENTAEVKQVFLRKEYRGRDIAGTVHLKKSRKPQFLCSFRLFGLVPTITRVWLWVQ